MELGLISFRKSLEVFSEDALAEKYCKMEKYENVENDALDVYKYVTVGTVGQQKYEKLHHNLQMDCHIEEDEKANMIKLVDIRVL